MTNPGHYDRAEESQKTAAVKAIIANVFVDSGLDLEAVRAVMEKLGFFEHPMLATTNCSSLADH
jgi:hypothetical protein